MKKLVACLLVLGTALAGSAQGARSQASSTGTFKVGGASIVLPAPSEDMVEVGPDNRGILDAFVAVGNRLVAGYVPTADLPKFESMSPDATFLRYAMVQVVRSVEYTDCKSSDFQEVVDMFEAEYGKVSEDIMKEATEDARKHLEQLDSEEEFSYGEIKQLGRLFSVEGAYGIGMIMPMSVGDKTYTLACCIGLMRVRQRLMFFYYYDEYKGRGTIEALRKVSSAWADSILKANK